MRDALNGANAGSFDEELNCEQGLVFRCRHGREQPRTIFGVRLATPRAAETLRPVAMLPELPALDAAFLAIHRCSL